VLLSGRLCTYWYRLLPQLRFESECRSGPLLNNIGLTGQQYVKIRNNQLQEGWSRSMHFRVPKNRDRCTLSTPPAPRLRQELYTCLNRLKKCFSRRVLLVALTLLWVCVPGRANVPTPPPPPAVPAGYCTTINDELNLNLTTLNTTLSLLPRSGFPTVYAANLSMANANTGPQIENAGYLPGVLNQLQEMKAMGVQAVMVQVGFPVLYRPFFPSGSSGQTQYNSVVSFYQQVAAAVRSLGLQLIVENDELLANDVQAGWTNTTAFYGALNWTQYQAARAQTAAVVASTLQPDYLVLAEEPDSEATQSGQTSLNDPASAAGMVSQLIAAVRALNLPNIKLGAGFGSWVANLLGAGGYLEEYLALNIPPNNLDYLDFHVYPTVTVGGISFLTDALTIATTANLAGMPVAMSEAWLWKMESSEWLVLGPDDYRARNPFSFWAPLDAYFLQVLQNLASRTQMLYQAPEGPYYLFTYQTYGGTAGNGGAATCMCTTSSCSDSQIAADEVSLSAQANLQTYYTTTGVGYYNTLVSPPDIVAPSIPTKLQGTAGYTQASVSWTASTDNVGVAGYNVIRDGVWIANSAETTFDDSGLTSSTTYHYQVQAFDLAGNTSASSQTLSLTTADNIPPTSPTNIIATGVSCQEINVSWSPAQDTSGLAAYRIFRGTSLANLVQVATRNGTTLSYKDYPLNPSTTYYYGIEAVDSSGNVSPMSAPLASGLTMTLPNAPSHVTATAVSGKQINVAWTETIPPNGLPIAAYHIFRGTMPGHLSQIATRTSTSYTDMSLTPSTTYYYEVQATDSGGNVSPISLPAAATTLPGPNAPANLTATAPASTRITLSWTETIPPNGLPISNYKIFCGKSLSSLTQVATVKNTTFTYSGLTAATTYYCAVQAVDTAGVLSQMSATVSATTPALPSAPTNVAATANSSTKVTVTWTETVPSGGLPIGSYKILRGASPSSLTQVATRTTTTYIDSTVSPATTYYYAVQAVDTGGDVSATSAVVQVTTPN
jgi:fibronectin type 3 domain-containing protein